MRTARHQRIEGGRPSLNGLLILVAKLCLSVALSVRVVRSILLSNVSRDVEWKIAQGRYTARAQVAADFRAFARCFAGAPDGVFGDGRDAHVAPIARKTPAAGCFFRSFLLLLF